MRTILRLLPATLLCLLSAAAHAVAVPLPTKDASLNIVVTFQPQFQLNEHGAPNGSDSSYDLFVRRTRLSASGDVGANWSYYFQIDNANFGKYGNFTSRLIVQDAWISWGPLGTKGDNVLLIEGGLIYYPNTRFTLTTSSSYPTIENHPDLQRGFTAASFPGTRTTGLQLRGWWFDKKVGFRGGIYEGVQPQPNPAAPVNPPLNSNRYPAFGGFVNVDLIGSEEGGYLYSSIYFAKDPILSVSVAGTYQADALRTVKGVANQRSLTSTVFFDYPLSEQQELVAILGGYFYGNGQGSRDTGKGFSADLGFRYQFVRPYVSYEYFNSDDCSPVAGEITGPQCAQAHTADSRNFRAGLDFYINKAQNHVQLEFSLNRGQSAFGSQSIAAANPGYTPFIPTGQLPATSLGREASKSFAAQWFVFF
ncbi:MAG TPA: porin [Myxococcales bacterium]|nr:porin [Myxococcales bacterium]